MSVMGPIKELATRVLKLVIKFMAEKPVPSSGTVSAVMLTVKPSTCSRF